jgi:hypothetical protein
MPKIMLGCKDMVLPSGEVCKDVKIPKLIAGYKDTLNVHAMIQTYQIYASVSIPQS